MTADNLVWTTPDLAFLRKQLMDGNVVLFLGAGFSSDARNGLGETPPLGRELARLLAQEACLPFHDDPLPLVYRAAAATIGDKNLGARLARMYSIQSIPDWYGVVRSTTWHRIYTTNIDNLVETLYKRPLNNGQALDSIVCPAEYHDRREDMSLLQCVHLHGHVEANDKPLTFKMDELAQQTTRSNPWYQQLMEDLYTRTVLFVGTGLSESPFYHYLEQRRAIEGADVGRPKSFLVARGISPIQRKALANLNIVAFDSDSRSFFEGLDAALPGSERSVDAVNIRVAPTLAPLETLVGRRTSLSQSFHLLVQGRLPSTHGKGDSLLYMGAEPTWRDIETSLDAERTITLDLKAQLNAHQGKFGALVLHGTAGSGKSASVMRVAFDALRDGSIVLFATQARRADLGDIPRLARNVAANGRRLVVCFDGVSAHLSSLQAMASELVSCGNLSLLLCDRTNVIAAQQPTLDALSPTYIQMPDLSKSDAETIISKLKQGGMLGALRGKSLTEQLSIFMDKASRQMLIAMREATSGRRFDMILKDEFDQLGPDAQFAYLMCCLGTAHGAPGVYRRHLIAATARTSRRNTVLLDQSLKGILVPANTSGSMLRPRHRVIAGLIARELSSVSLRVEATVNLLAELSGDVTPSEIKLRSPAYIAYRGLINSDGLEELLGGDGPRVLGIYKSVRQYYDGDFLFWVQYGRAHVRLGHLDIAENYIRQSLEMRSKNNFQALHQLGIIYLMQAAAAANPGSMTDRAAEGIEILQQQIRERGDQESYAFSAYLVYVAKWYLAARSIISTKQWEDLRRMARLATTKYPLNDVVKESARDVERAYLQRIVAQ